MQDYIDDVFGPRGFLAHALDGYMPRPGQIEMARAVDAAIRDQARLLVEAPTGTGKGVAYAVPAIWHAVHRQKRVVIATANIALQEQLCNKDLPLLARALPWQFSYALLKGKHNYLCRSRLAEGPEGIVDIDRYREILAWASRTDTGDISELPFEPSPQLWRRFAVTSEDCTGNHCRFADDCYARRAKDRADDVDVVVVNFHLLLLHLQLRELTGRDLVLPPFDIVICDEGHKLADIARDFFGFRITEGSLRWAGRRLSQIGRSALATALAKTSAEFFRALAAHARSDAYHRRLRQQAPVPWRAVYDVLMDAHHAYQRAIDSELDEDVRADALRCAARSMNLAIQIELAMTLGDNEQVYYLEPIRQGGMALASKSVSVGERLQAQLETAVDSVIITSATLTTAGGSFDYMKRELGLEDARTSVVVTPFDYAAQALLVVPDGMPAPGAYDYADAVADMIGRVVQEASGRTLALFTSYRNLEATYERIHALGYPVLRQGDAPRTTLIAQFRADVRSVLLGTESFWAGVDVPGEALSCVVIDRLPFLPPDDPVLDAISQRDPDWFRTHSLPRAVIAFKQGFGRLIRSHTDRGVVVVLDERLATKGYGRRFLKSLPFTYRSRKLEHVREFLGEVAA